MCSTCLASAARTASETQAGFKGWRPANWASMCPLSNIQCLPTVSLLSLWHSHRCHSLPTHNAFLPESAFPLRPLTAPTIPFFLCSLLCFKSPCVCVWPAVCSLGPCCSFPKIGEFVFHPQHVHYVAYVIVASIIYKKLFSIFLVKKCL